MIRSDRGSASNLSIIIYWNQWNNWSKFWVNENLYFNYFRIFQSFLCLLSSLQFIAPLCIISRVIRYDLTRGGILIDLILQLIKINGITEARSERIKITILIYFPFFNHHFNEWGLLRPGEFQWNGIVLNNFNFK